MSSDPIQCQIFENGPIQMSGVPSLSFAGESIPVEGDVYVCRCGQSKNAPFCDGTHSKVGFDGSVGTAPKKDVVVWEGQTIRTRFNPNACMHAYYCKPLKALRKAEVGGDASAAAEIARVVSTCPSGALSYEMKGDAEAPNTPAAPVAVDIMEGGEVRMQAAFSINAELPEGLDGTRATLCRCGLSKNKPWCDGRHVTREGWK